MTRSRIFKALILAATISVPAPALADSADLRGDPEAVAAIEHMMDRFGGDAVWARARSLYVEYDGWRTQPNEPVMEYAWRDLEETYQRSEYVGQSFHTIAVLTPDEAWYYGYTSGNFIEVDAEALAQRRDRYPFGFYTILHAFASGDPRITLEWQAPDTVIVHNSQGPATSQWRTDSTGALLEWQATLADGTSYAYVYGPMRSFGLVNFPEWGIASDASWRWNYTRVEISPEAPPVTFDPPAAALVE